MSCKCNFAKHLAIGVKVKDRLCHGKCWYDKEHPMRTDRKRTEHRSNIGQNLKPIIGTGLNVHEIFNQDSFSASDMH